MPMRPLALAVGLLLTLTTAHAQERAGDQANEKPQEQPVDAPTGPAEQGPISRLPTITVTGSAVPGTGYTVPRATTATKTDTPIMETPVSVQVVPQQVLQDMQVLSLPDAVTGTVSGVLGRTGGGFQYDNFIIRGIPGSGFGQAYRNGLINRSYIYNMANIQRVEVIKGPAAVLYGRIQPGGLVNYVTKRPLAVPYHAIQQQFQLIYDDSSFVRTTVDLTGPLTDNGSLLYRLNAAYTDFDSFRDFVFNEEIFVAPVLTWRPSNRFELTVEAEYKDKTYLYDIGIPAVGDRPAPIPIERGLSDGPNDFVSVNSTLLAYDWTWRISNDWKLINRFLWVNRLETNHLVILPRLQPDGRTLKRSILLNGGNHHVDREAYATNLDLIGDFEIGSLKQELLVGIDFYNAETTSLRVFKFNGAPPIDIFDPVYGLVDYDALTMQDPSSFYRLVKWFGVYVQDHIQFGPWHLLLGGRYDWAETGSAFGPGSLTQVKAQRIGREDTAFSPRVGLLYEVADWLSLYGSYSESFGSNNGVSSTGESFDPQKGEQFEVGIKYQSPDDRLRATVSAFRITKSNILTDDPNSGNPRVRILAGEIVSQGVELDISGQVTEQLNLLATYAYLDTEYTQSFSGLEGNRPDNVPRHQGSVWGVWQFTPALRAGLGVFAVSDRFADDENTATLPGYVRLDAMLSYDLHLVGKPVQLQLNVENLLDKRYYAYSSGNRNSILPGAPRTFLMSVRVEF